MDLWIATVQLRTAETDRLWMGLANYLAKLGLVCEDHVAGPGTVHAVRLVLVEGCYSVQLPLCQLAVLSTHHVLPLLPGPGYRFYLRV